MQSAEQRKARRRYRSLMDRAERKLGDARKVLLLQALDEADRSGDPKLAGLTRMELFDDAHFSGSDPQLQLAVFHSLASQFDSDAPWIDWWEKQQILELNRELIGDLLRHPEIPLDTIANELDKYAARTERAGRPMNGVAQARYQLALHRHGHRAAIEAFDAWNTLPRSETSARVGKETLLRVEHFREIGEHRLALGAFEDFLPGHWPDDPYLVPIMTAVTESALAEGLAEQALMAHLRATSALTHDDMMHRLMPEYRSPDSVAMLATIMRSCARSGTIERGLDLIRRHWNLLAEQVGDPLTRLRLYSACYAVLNQCIELGIGTHRLIPLGGPPTTIAELAAEYLREAARLGAAFDVRNGTPVQGRSVTELVRDPGLGLLPLAGHRDGKGYGFLAMRATNRNSHPFAPRTDDLDSLDVVELMARADEVYRWGGEANLQDIADHWTKRRVIEPGALTAKPKSAAEHRVYSPKPDRLLSRNRHPSMGFRDPAQALIPSPEDFDAELERLLRGEPKPSGPPGITERPPDHPKSESHTKPGGFYQRLEGVGNPPEDDSWAEFSMPTSAPRVKPRSREQALIDLDYLLIWSQRHPHLDPSDELTELAERYREIGAEADALICEQRKAIEEGDEERAKELVSAIDQCGSLEHRLRARARLFSMPNADFDPYELTAEASSLIGQAGDLNPAERALAAVLGANGAGSPERVLETLDRSLNTLLPGEWPEYRSLLLSNRGMARFRFAENDAGMADLLAAERTAAEAGELTALSMVLEQRARFVLDEASGERNMLRARWAALQAGNLEALATSGGMLTELLYDNNNYFEAAEYLYDTLAQLDDDLLPDLPRRRYLLVRLRSQLSRVGAKVLRACEDMLDTEENGLGSEIMQRQAIDDLEWLGETGELAYAHSELAGLLTNTDALEALHEYDLALEFAVDEGDVHLMQHLYRVRAQAVLIADGPDAALAALDKAAAENEELAVEILVDPELRENYHSDPEIEDLQLTEIRVRILRAGNRSAEALTELDKLEQSFFVQQQPGALNRLRVLRGELLMDVGNIDAAISEFRTAAETAREEGDLELARFAVFRGAERLFEAGQPEAAQDFWISMIPPPPDNPEDE